MKNLKKKLGRWIRKTLWPNWSYKGEFLNKESKLIMVFHDKDYPEFEKKLMLGARVDLTDTKYPRRYLYSVHQLIHDHVVQHIKLTTGKQVELRFSVIHRGGGALHYNEQVELLELVKVMDWSSIVWSMKPEQASFVVDDQKVMKDFERKREEHRLDMQAEDPNSVQFADYMKAKAEEAVKHRENLHSIPKNPLETTDENPKET